ERVCAIDVAKAPGKVCTRVPHPSRPGARRTRVQDVDATTNAILELGGHLAGEGIEKVTLESTPDYWRIWFYLLEASGLDVRLVNADGVVVVPAAEFFRELAACGRPAATHRSYGMDLLRWWRFLWATGIGWDQAASSEARDFCCWIGRADKPPRRHWRYPGGGAPGTGTAVAPGTPYPVTGKRSPGRGYAAAAVVHCESVLRGFYGFHLEAGTGPMVNPFPLARSRRPGRHRSPMELPTAERSGRYRPRVVPRAPRCIPDHRFNELSARLGSHRDRGPVA